MKATDSYRTHQISDGNNTYAMTTQKADLRAIAVTRDAIWWPPPTIAFQYPRALNGVNLSPLLRIPLTDRISGVAIRGMLQHWCCRNTGLA